MGDIGSDLDRQGYQSPESKALGALEQRVAELERRLAVIEGRRTDQIGFVDVASTWPVGNVPDQNAIDDEERFPHRWAGDHQSPGGCR